jgi:hypothetical protein
VNIDHRIEVCLGHFVDVDVLRVAGVVHEVIEAVATPGLQRLADVSNKSIKRANVTGVQGKACRFLPHGFDLANETLGLFLTCAIGEEDVDAASRKIDGGVAAQAAASAGDNSDLICHHLNSFA